MDDWLNETVKSYASWTIKINNSSDKVEYKALNFKEKLLIERMKKMWFDDKAIKVYLEKFRVKFKR